MGGTEKEGELSEASDLLSPVGNIELLSNFQSEESKDD